MLRIPIVTNHAFVIELENMVENLAQPSFDKIVELRNLKSSTQVALAQGCHNLMSLPHLPTQKTNGRKPLVDYSQSHVVNSKEYSRIMRQKEMDKEVTKHIKKRKGKKTSKKNIYRVDCS
jgi:hypothetical protein